MRWSLNPSAGFCTMMSFFRHNDSGTRSRAFRFAMAMKACAFFLACAFLFAGCADKEPRADERLVAAYVEIRVADQTFGAESPAARLAHKTILEKYGYDRLSFVEACDKVLADQKMWVPFQRAVTERVDSLLGIPKPVKDAKKGKGKK